MPASIGLTARLLVGACAVTVAGCTVNVNTDGATASETHRFAVTGAPTVTLDTFDGAIEVHSWDRQDVEVVVEKQAQDEARLQEITVEQQQDGNTVSLRARGPAASTTSGVVIGMNVSPSARLRVALPKHATLDLRSGDGSITVEEITGTVVLRSEDGSIVVARVDGELRARTDDGAIRVRETTGKIDVETSDGSIVVNGVLTHLRAKTGDGSVRVAVEAGSRAEDDWAIETRDGSVEVRLPDVLDLQIDAVTSDGRVRSNYPGLTVAEKDDDERGSRRELRGPVGAGGRVLRVRTADGTIRFER